MSSILDLPIEILDYVFDYLGAGDQMRAKLVCYQWNHQLSSLRYRKATKLRLTPHFLTKWPVEDILQAIRQAKHHCIEVCDFYALSGRASQQCIETLVQMLEVSRCSLEELSLEDCSEKSLRAVFGVLGKARRLRHLRVELHRELFSRVSLPKVPRVAAEPVVFAFMTHLEVTLGNASCVELVSSLASQLTHLALTVYRKDLLLRCWNEVHLSALRSLTVATADAAEIDFILPGELGAGCWRMLEQLETFTCTDATLLYMALAEMLRLCRNLTCLVIEHCNLSSQCVEQIGTLEGLKSFCLNLFRSIGDSSRDSPTLHLPNLEHLHLSTENDIRLGKQLPRLTSVVIENPLRSFCPKAILSKVTKIVGIGGRRLRTLLFKGVHLDREANGWLGALSIDELRFERCRIDGSVLDVLAKSQTPRACCRVLMDDCILTFNGRQSYSVRTVAGLRAKCPRLQIATNGIHVLSGRHILDE